MYVSAVQSPKTLEAHVDNLCEGVVTEDVPSNHGSSCGLRDTRRAGDVDRQLAKTSSSSRFGVG